MHKENGVEKIKIRGFEVVADKHRKHPKEDVKLPTRSDTKSAGYDFYSLEDVVLKPGDSHMFWTDIKAYMQDDEVLMIHARSSLGIKSVTLINRTGVIDSSYYNNEKNDGNIGIKLVNEYVNNMSDTEEGYVKIKKGDKIAQGIFQKYLTVDDDKPISTVRTGGFGSSGK